MKKIILILLVCFAVQSAISSVPTMSVKEIQPGMKGVGRTIFAGDTIEEFEFEVLEIIPNFRAKRELILVKLVGEKVEHTNVVAGMSGSPMYIDGKLIGALSYRMGIFLKDPIAGITPIDQMFEILDHEKNRPQELALNTGKNFDFVDMAVGIKPVTYQALIPPQFEHIARANQVSSKIRPISLPLIFSGFSRSALTISEQIFSGSGFELFQGGGAAVSEEVLSGELLEPGSAYAVVLVDGDYGLQATGTVTYVDGKNVIGMGHPFLNYGAVGLPMAKVKILTTISSLMASTKISALTHIVGTVHQDRTTGVMGVLGETPKMIPFNLSFTSEVEPLQEFKFRVAEERSLHSLTPLIFAIILNNALESARLSVTSQTLKLDGKINLKDHGAIPLKNYYAGASSSFVTDAIQATGEVAAVLGSLLSNSFEQPEIESVDLKFEVLHKKHLVFVDRFEVNKTSVKPGDVVTLTVYLKEYQGEEYIVQHSVKIPDGIRAKRVNIYAGSGATLTQLEARTSPQKFRPKNFKHLLELINNRRKNNYVFFQLRLPDKGIQLEGKEFPGLPPSILSVMKSQKSVGSMNALRDRVLLEEKIQTDYAVTGGKSIWLKIELK